MSDDTEDAEGEDSELFEQKVGEILRDARQNQGIHLPQIAKATRIPLRQLENIENCDYDAMPAPTYAVGFVKSYSREVGLDQNAIAAQFREEISYRTTNETAGEYFEPTDPARVPPRSLALIAAAIAIILAVGYGIWRSGMFGEDAEDRQRLAAGTDEPVAEEQVSVEDAVQTAASGERQSSATGPVILQATDTVWLRIYNLETDERIYEATMEAGDRYEIPETAQNPAILTGRPDQLRVTVGGQQIPPLGEAEQSISGVSLSPEDLVRRRAATDTDEQG